MPSPHLPAPPPAADTLPAATPIAFVRAIALAYARRGMDPARALAQAQIAPQRLQDDTARITAWQMERISEAAMRELDDEALGWFSRRLPWGSYGLLARASISAPSLGLALARWCRHHGLLTEGITLRLGEEGGMAEVRLDDLPPPSHPLLREFCHVSVLRNIHGLACWFIDSRIPLLEAQFSSPAPAHQGSYAVLFPTPAPVRFGAPYTALRFDARYLDLPLRRDEAALNKLLQNALPLMVQAYRRDRLLVERVRQWLHTLPAAQQTAEGLAPALHLSPRTLHRQLHEQGASLQALKDAVRRERAETLLTRGRQAIKQVAQAAGFSNEKSFSRAFRQWTGLTPGEFRRQAQTPPAPGPQ
ncbi:MAG: AraC family transcriptional regulator [Burkholderiaceae bacterium]|nr:AraC family transcriptional regulator [Burkholderiaceae bacterium]